MRHAAERDPATRPDRSQPPTRRGAEPPDTRSRFTTRCRQSRDDAAFGTQYRGEPRKLTARRRVRSDKCGVSTRLLVTVRAARSSRCAGGSVQWGRPPPGRERAGRATSVQPAGFARRDICDDPSPRLRQAAFRGMTCLRLFQTGQCGRSIESRR